MVDFAMREALVRRKIEMVAEPFGAYARETGPDRTRLQ